MLSFRTIFVVSEKNIVFKLNTYTHHANQQKDHVFLVVLKRTSPKFVQQTYPSLIFEVSVG